MCKGSVVLDHSNNGSGLAITGRSLQAGDLGEAVSTDGQSTDAPLPNVALSVQSPPSPALDEKTTSTSGDTHANMQPPSNTLEAQPAPVDLPEATHADPKNSADNIQSSSAGKDAVNATPTDPVVVDQGLPAANTVISSSSSSADDSWVSAPACSAVPNATTAVLDESGRLWGWENEASCAYKTASVPLFFWETAPGCGPTGTNGDIVQDSMGRSWGWEDGHSCAIKVRD